MKPTMNQIPSMYEEKQFKKAGLQLNKLHLISLIVLLLLVVRFFNLFMWWGVNHLELNQKTQGKEFKYKVMYFSSIETAKRKCKEISQQSPQTAVTVVSVLNLLQPGVFIVNNTAPFSAVDLGRFVVPLGPGLFSIKWSMSGFVSKQLDTQKQESYIENSILESLLKTKKTGADTMSFIVKPLQNSSYLKIPYLVYFLFPLVLLLIFSSMYSQAVLAGFFYFTGLFLLFDFKELFFSIPLGWLMRLLGISDSTSFEGLVAIVIGGLLTLIGFIGVLNWKSRREIFKETLIVITFVLIPVVLRF